MDGSDYQRLLNDANTFRPTGYANCIEAWTFSATSRTLCDKKQIPEEHIQAWWSSKPNDSCGDQLDTDQPQAGLKILAISSWNDMPDDILNGLSPLTERDSMILLPLTISRTTFEFLERVLRLPEIYLTTLERRTPVYETFEAEGQASNSQVGLGYLIQDNISKWVQCSIFVRAISAVTYALVVGGDSLSCDTVYTRLRHAINFIRCPLLLPILEMGIKADYARQVLDKCHRHLNDFEPTTGFHIDDDKNTKGDLMEPEVFDKQIRRLTATTGRLAWCNWCGEVQADLLTFLETELSDLNSQVPNGKEEYEVLVRKLAYLKTFVKQNKARAVYLEARRTGYIQTLYNLIAQKDNAENIRLADASVRMAELGNRGNAAMKAIAEDSKMVAVATLRDSAAMRTIAAVTVYFLPATFTATLFSTTFFNFQKGEGAIVSNWIWLYILLTAVLTALTNFAWFWGLRRKDEQIKQQHDDAHRDAEDKELDERREMGSPSAETSQRERRKVPVESQDACLLANRASKLSATGSDK